MDWGPCLSVWGGGGGGGGGGMTVLACLISVLFVLAHATWVVLKELPDII